MARPKVIRRVVVGAANAPTGRTRHYKGVEELPSPVELRIVQYANDPGYYLFDCDAGSADGLGQFRPPSFKPSLDRFQANFESRPPGFTQWQSNAHLDILD